MTGFRTISGKAAWGNQNVRSQDVKSYQATHGGARPEPEFRKVGGKVEIRTGAHALTARNIPQRRAWPGVKTFLQSIRRLRFVGLAETTPAAPRMRKAGREFDKGVSALVSDLANGKVKNAGDLADQIGALHETANELRMSGGDIEKRFETNLMESLKALQKADPDKARAVLKDLQTFAFDGMQDYFFRPLPQDVSKTHDAIANNLEMAVGSNVDQRAAADFAKSMIATLRRASVFGPNIEKHAAFGGSQMKGDAFGFDVAKLKAFDGNVAAFKEFGGDPAKAKAFNNDISAHRAFGGDLEAYKRFGGSGELFTAFSGAPESLKGNEGAERLKTWIDETYGRGQGEIFLNRHQEFGHGVDGPELAGLGHAVQNELEAFAQRGYQFNDSRFDALTSVSVDDPARTLLK
ncbi:MAG: hypothetical protein GY933_01455, partial [Hyphomicrobiales bacterium]|nr:hypothetical protein [Hyphomicrobiales bacterium]